ncbi:TPA: helix-turn-helix transcriptional regulator [Salmonella enterica]|uniref:helix-turn-helix transcriptional regulator n=1 Tax=Salmonella sp. SG203 TaxID=2555397 RepID=UPI0015827807|nr:hypothetical protein [Salmonella sp. SG203]
MSNILDGLHDRLVSELKRVGPLVVSRVTGISRATIYNWMEKGNVPLDKLSLLASAGVDVTFILTGSYVVPEAAEYGTVKNADEAEMLAEYREGSEEARDAARYTLTRVSNKKRETG